MRGLVAEAGLGGSVQVDSAGTGSWHLGDPPDPRAVDAAAERGVELTGAARQVSAADFEAFDLLVAMDAANRDALRQLAPDEEARGKVRLLREFADGVEADVPDPYYGGEDGFAEVVEIVERNCRALLADVTPAARAPGTGSQT